MRESRARARCSHSQRQPFYTRPEILEPFSIHVIEGVAECAKCYQARQGLCLSLARNGLSGDEPDGHVSAGFLQGDVVKDGPQLVFEEAKKAMQLSQIRLPFSHRVAACRCPRACLRFEGSSQLGYVSEAWIEISRSPSEASW